MSIAHASGEDERQFNILTFFISIRNGGVRIGSAFEMPKLLLFVQQLLRLVDEWEDDTCIDATDD